MPKPTDTLIMPRGIAARQRLGHYEIVQEIGRGGMSRVHEARDTRDGRRVALKVLHVPPELSPDQAQAMLARFEREARAVALLSHPNIVGIHEIGHDAGRHFLVMEYLSGETLRRRLEHGPLTPAQSVGTIRQIAAALDAVHAAGVVHRDIKPSNIMLLPDGSAKLLDFGVARQSDDSTVTGTGALVGSPAYMSPEQVRGEPGTAASDIWALGALLYEMLAGHPPFAGNTIPAVLYQVTHEAPALVIGVPTPVQRVLRRALAKSAPRRYPTARALADAFARAVSSAPEAARPGWASKAAALASLAVLLGLGIVLGLRHLAHLSPVGSLASPGSLAPPSHLAHPQPNRAAMDPVSVVRHPRRSPARTGHTAAKKKSPMKLNSYHPHRSPRKKHRLTRLSGFRPERRFRFHRDFRRRPHVMRVYRVHHDSQAAQNLDKFIYSPESPG